MRAFGTTSNVLASFVVSIYILGFALGPLIIAPMSELYGRIWIFHVCNVLFVIFNIACAVSNSMGMLVAFRFLAGCAGSAPLTIGGGVIGMHYSRMKDSHHSDFSSRYIPRRETSWSHGNLGNGATFGTCSWPRSGWFPCRGQGLAMGFLGPLHRCKLCF